LRGPSRAHRLREAARIELAGRIVMLDVVHVLVVDHESRGSDWLVRMLELRGYRVEGVAVDFDQALSLARLAHVALVLLASRTAFGAIEIGRALIDRCDLAVLYVVAELDEALLLRARESCPSGFLFQPVTPTALYGTIEVSKPLRVSEHAASYSREISDETQLTPREREIYQALLSGVRPPEIARTFYISIHTVRRHAQAVFRKLGVHSQIELMHRFGTGSPRRKSM
jgi:DNA-binding NarL/FixJ family response regulator